MTRIKGFPAYFDVPAKYSGGWAAGTFPRYENFWTWPFFKWVLNDYHFFPNTDPRIGEKRVEELLLWVVMHFSFHF